MKYLLGMDLLNVTTDTYDNYNPRLDKNKIKNCHRKNT